MKDDDNHILLLEKGKRGLLQIIFGRTGIIIVSLIVQILFLFAAFYKLEGFLPYFWGGNTLLSAAVVLFLFGNDDNPTIKLTWFFILAVLPVFGLILYVYIKTDLGHRLMIRRYNDILSQTEHFAPSESACSKEELPEELQSLASYLNSCGFPCYQNTQAQYFPIGDDAFEVMCDELQKAEHFIFLEYFIVREGYMWGRILEILKEKVNAGVEVRVLYDGTCAVALLPYSYPEKLEKLGIACKMFAPLRPFVSTHYNYRDHRKIMVIDGKIGFTGGINLSDEYINRTSRLGHWKDTAIVLRGDAVRSLTLMFLQMWDVSSVHFTPEVYSKYLDVPQPAHEKEAGYVIPYGDSPLDRDLVGEMVYMDIINRANRYVHIMTPYLIIDNEMITALTYAARRGVEVQLILPHVPDKEIAFSLAHTYYRRLLENGVQIYEYEPGFVHAKVFVSDDCKATVGTINLDYRSLYHHFECGTYLYASPEVAKIEQDFQQTLARCVRADAELLKNDPFMRKLIGPGMRIIAPAAVRSKKVETERFRLFLFSITFRAARARCTRQCAPSAPPHRVAVRFQASNPDRAQRFRHLRAGVGERAEAKVQRHALERVHRAERRSRVARVHRIRQVLHAVVAREHIKEAHDALVVLKTRLGFAVAADDARADVQFRILLDDDLVKRGADGLQFLL